MSETAVFTLPSSVLASAEASAPECLCPGQCSYDVNTRKDRFRKLSRFKTLFPTRNNYVAQGMLSTDFHEVTHHAHGCAFISSFVAHNLPMGLVSHLGLHLLPHKLHINYLNTDSVF